MADNVGYTPGSGITIATEDVGGVHYQRIISEPSDASFLERIALRALAKLTYTLTGMRVDCGGSSVAVASLPTLANVTTVAAVTTLAGLGYNNQNGQAIQQSQLAVQCGFRRNIT
jgi:hypothetical protein